MAARATPPNSRIMGDHYPFKFHHSTSRAHQGCIELTTSDAAIRFHADGAVTVDTTIQAHERSDYLRDGESPNDVDEIDLLATTTQSLRLAALHAQLRAGTTGTAITSLAAWANAAIDVRGRKPGDYTDRVGISPLHTHLVRYTSEIALDSVAINEGSAAHAAWLILNELYQEQLGTPTSTLMGHDGNYRLHLLDDRGATLHIVDHNPDVTVQ